MSRQMADPHIGMVSFQKALLKGIVDIHLVKPHKNLFSHFDVPALGENRLTYVRLDGDGKTVLAFLVCVINGKIDGIPIVSLGYAVPENMRKRGYAKAIMHDAIKDQIKQAGRSLYFETMVDVDNVASQRVSESVLEVAPEELVEADSERPAYRYTKRVDPFTN